MGKKGTILKELDDAIRIRKEKMNSKSLDKSSLEFDLCKKQLRALLEIDDAVSKYEWVGKQDAVERIKFVRDSHFDYDLVREKYNMSESALKSFMFRLNKKLSDYIGEDTIDLIVSRHNKISLGLIQFRVCSGQYSLSNIFIKGFYEKLPPEKLDLYNIFDCKEEIKLLYYFSNFNMQQKLAECDMDKLAWLIYIMQHSTERYKEEQKDLISLYQGINIRLEDYMGKISELETKYNDNSYLDFINELPNSFDASEDMGNFAGLENFDNDDDEPIDFIFTSENVMGDVSDDDEDDLPYFENEDAENVEFVGLDGEESAKEDKSNDVLNGVIDFDDDEDLEVF